MASYGLLDDNLGFASKVVGTNNMFSHMVVKDGDESHGITIRNPAHGINESK